MRALILVLALVTFAGCETHTDKAETLKILDAEERAERADLLKQRAECRSIEYEFGSADIATKECWNSYAVIESATAKLIADINARRQELGTPKGCVKPGLCQD